MHCACAILSSVAYPALQHFPTLPPKDTTFDLKKVTEHKMCVLIFSTTGLKYFSFYEEVHEI